MMKEKYVIFDLDGCLSDDLWRRELITDEYYDAYHERCLDDQPINLDVLNEHKRLGHRILFITARPAKWGKQTLDWLHKHAAPLDNFVLEMRPDDNSSTSPIFKHGIAQHYLREPHVTIVHAYDDREDVLEAYDELGIACTQLKREAPATVADALRSMASTFEQRHKTYGNSYLTFGKVAVDLWPDGLVVKTEEDFNRLGVLVQCIGKLVRYTGTPSGHVDSAHDLAVYAAMLESIT